MRHGIPGFVADGSGGADFSARLELTKGTLGEVALQLGPWQLRMRQELGGGTFSVDSDGIPIFTDAAGKAYPVKFELLSY